MIGKKKININNAIKSIKHRGPDDVGEYHDINITLGFRRLSIIDLSPKGHQPMTNEDKTVWIIFNGEIYNYVELKKELITKHRFRSNTDTETLIHGYEQWGIEKLLKKVNGMFAFCLYDKKKNAVFLARDRIGKKPLYYYQSKNTLVFSSETKAFFKLPNFDFQIDQNMFKLWMGFPYLPDNEKTILKNIYKIPPASYMMIGEDGRSTIKKYWKLSESSSPLNFSDAKSELEKLLIESVTKRLIADVPVGILLSGGVDSSLITALAAKYSESPVKTITISFKNSAIDETPYAKIVAKHCQTNHVNLSLRVADIYEEFRSNIWIYDDLSTTDSGLFSSYLLAKKIRGLGVKVILVGEGADEIFGGYSWFQLSQYPFKLLPDTIKSQLYYYAIMRKIPNKNFFKYSSYLYQKLQESKNSFFKKIQQYEINYSLPNHYCMKVDKGTMAASIEARAPYMDYRVVELASQLPDHYLLRSSFFNLKQINEKYILRRIAEKYLPKVIYERKKKGGMIPVYDLLHIGLKKDKELILNNNYLAEYYSKNYLSRLIDSRPSSPVYRWQREWILWKCLVFSLWYHYYSTS